MKTFEQFINESIDNIDDSILNILHINELNIKFNFFEDDYSETRELYFCFVDYIFFTYEKKHEQIWLECKKYDEISSVKPAVDYNELNNKLIKFFSKYFYKVIEIRQYYNAHKNGLKKSFEK